MKMWKNEDMSMHYNIAYYNVSEFGGETELDRVVIDTVYGQETSEVILIEYNSAFYLLGTSRVSKNWSGYSITNKIKEKYLRLNDYEKVDYYINSIM